MKKTALALTLLLTGVVLAHSQDRFNAVVLENRQTFTMQSSSSASLKVFRKVLVLNENGLDEAVFLEYTDLSRSIASFSGTVERAGAKPMKIKKSDIETVSASSGLAEDGFTNGYVPSSSYPFTVTYDYTIEYRKGFTSFPPFIPVSNEKTKLEAGSCQILVPSGTAISHFSSGAGEVTLQQNGKYDSYSWEIPKFEGFISEPMMPSPEILTPVVLACPMEFSFAGSHGEQGSWEDVGKWAWELKQDCSALPDDFAAQVRDMVSGCSSDLEKVKVLYGFLREKTRYVSIQLGIGGYKPYPASTILKTGFGDCKGLSNFMQAMLSEAGISSQYALLNTRRAKMIPGFPCIGMMNHVMLRVPLPEMKDTLWVECTNPKLPLGYRHTSVAGHEAVLATADGGALVTVPSYPDSLSRTTCEMDIDLKPDGSACVSAIKGFYLDNAEPWVGAKGWKRETLQKHLTEGLKVQPQDVRPGAITDNFSDYSGAGYCPWIRIAYSFDVRQYATAGRDRLFVCLNPCPKNIPVQRSERVNDMTASKGGVIRDVIRIFIPEGYSAESIPADADIDSVWGSFSSRVSESGGVITIIQEFRGKRFRESRDSYPDFRTFAKTVNKAYDATLVLAKTSNY